MELDGRIAIGQRIQKNGSVENHAGINNNNNNKECSQT